MVDTEPILSVDDSRHSPGVHCVFLTCFTHDIEFFQRMLAYSEIRLHQAETLDEADFLLTVTASKVLLSDTVFLDGSWADALEMLSRFHPRSTFLVAADTVDSEFVRDAVNRGACAVLWKPLDWAHLTRWIRTVHEAALERNALDQESVAPALSSRPAPWRRGQSISQTST